MTHKSKLTGSYKQISRKKTRKLVMVLMHQEMTIMTTKMVLMTTKEMVV